MAYVKLRPRRSTAAQWEYANPILSEGEFAVEVPDTGVGTGLINIKIGDGVTSWNNLPYAFNAATLNDRVTELQVTVDGYNEIINNVEEAIEVIERKIVNIRKIEIQASEPQDDLVLGEIWIETEVVTGSLALNTYSLDMQAGNTAQLLLSNTLSSYTAIRWASTDSNVAELSNITNTSCTVTAKIRGNCKVNVWAELDSAVIYSLSCDVTVSVEGTIQVRPSELRLVIGNTDTLFLVNTLTSFDEVEWVSSAESFANVTAASNTQATVMAYKSGGATIYARVKLNGSVIDTAYSVVTVVGMNFTVDSATLDVGANKTIALNNTMTLGTDYDTIEWITSAPNVITILSSGGDGATIAGAGAGHATLTCQAKKDGVTVQSIDLPVTVVGHISLNETFVNMQVGETRALVLTNSLAPTDYDTITWTTTDSAIVRINSDVHSETSATIEARDTGSAVITVTAYLAGRAVDQATCTINTTGSLVMDQTTKSLSIGTTATLTATNTLSPSSYSQIRWTTNDATICSVTSYSGTQCQITGNSAGTCTITVMAVDANGAMIASDFCSVTIS